MPNGALQVPAPRNEPVLDYAPGSAERAALKVRLDRMLGEQVEIPVLIGGREVHTGRTQNVVCPHDHGHVLGTCHQAGAAEVDAAVAASQAAWPEWSAMPFEERAAIFLRAAELLAGSWRSTVNAATMLNQSKTCYQAEIDAACELVDFLRFQRRVRGRALRPAACFVARDLELRRVPGARGLRVRGHAVQLHGDRWQPADLGGDHGQHRAVEAPRRRRCCRATTWSSCSRRPVCRRE